MLLPCPPGLSCHTLICSSQIGWASSPCQAKAGCWRQPFRRLAQGLPVTWLSSHFCHSAVKNDCFMPAFDLPSARLLCPGHSSLQLLPVRSFFLAWPLNRLRWKDCGPAFQPPFPSSLCLSPSSRHGSPSDVPAFLRTFIQTSLLWGHSICSCENNVKAHLKKIKLEYLRSFC